MEEVPKGAMVFIYYNDSTPTPGKIAGHHRYRGWLIINADGTLRSEVVDKPEDLGIWYWRKDPFPKTACLVRYPEIMLIDKNGYLIESKEVRWEFIGSIRDEMLTIINTKVDNILAKAKE